MRTRRRFACNGTIKRYGAETGCSAGAAYAVVEKRQAEDDVVKGACRHHVAQVIDGMEAKSLVVVVLPDVTTVTEDQGSEPGTLTP